MHRICERDDTHIKVCGLYPLSEPAGVERKSLGYGSQRRLQHTHPVGPSCMTLLSESARALSFTALSCCSRTTRSTWCRNRSCSRTSWKPTHVMPCWGRESLITAVQSDHYHKPRSMLTILIGVVWEQG